MVRLTYKWKYALFSYLSLLIIADSLPITNVRTSSSDTDIDISESVDPVKAVQDINVPVTDKKYENELQTTEFKAETTEENLRGTSVEKNEAGNGGFWNVPRTLHAGQTVERYVIEMTRDGNTIRGRAVLTIVVTEATRHQPLRLHCEGLTVQEVGVGIFTDANETPANFWVNNGVLEINPATKGSPYIVNIQYTAPLRTDGTGMFISEANDVDFVAMNMHPVNARRVFPCVDEPNEQSTISFTFNGFEYNGLVTNSMLEANSETSFRPLIGPVHTWGMVAHNMNNINVPITNVLLYVRPNIANQEGQASVAINSFFTNLNEWTNKPYFEIILHQDERLHIFSLPDTNRDWYALSTICIWEPYVLMEVTHSVKQRTAALTAISEGMARQWFGYALFPQNFRFQWVITGLAKYASYEVLKTFQTSNNPEGQANLLDVNSIFTADIIQESLLRDSYGTAQPMETNENIFNENVIRATVNGLINYKAAAIMRMWRVVLGDANQDFIRSGARALLSRTVLQPINSVNFYDAINSEWLFEGNEIIDNIANFAKPWVESKGYPLLNVGLLQQQGRILLTQEHFSFSSPGSNQDFRVPVSYTLGTNPQFDNIHPVMMLDNIPTQLNLELNDDWVLFNVQGQGYYRVNYDGELWGRIIGALFDEERREAIHVLNRASLLDDSLILARANKLGYDVAFQVALAMEHETEYAPWKAFVRNMEFIRKHLVAQLDDNGWDEDIYVRMIGRTIAAFEEEIGFEPDPQINEPAMVSLTRGLVMEHACRAEYDMCIAAAIDWFYDPNDPEVVNPRIPHEIRPAVYCTMVREGGEDVIEALEARLEEEPTLYERLVILEAMACSQDGDFIRKLLQDTVEDESPYGLEERARIFKAVAESSAENTDAAISFLTRNTQGIRNRYGGADRLDEVIYAVADNIVNSAQLEQFTSWMDHVNSDLWDSLDVARRARDQARENMAWHDRHLEDIYEWILENDAPSLIVSSVLMLASLCIALFNY